LKSVAQKIAAGSAAGALVRLTVCLVALAAALWAFAAMPSRATEEDKGVLADLISRALSSEATQVSIGAVDGALSSNASISDIVLSDKDGPWLKIDRVKLVWRRAALVSRRLEVDQLLIHKLEFLRKPTPSDAPAQTDTAPILPELPLKVEIKEFAVGELELGAPILGTSASLSMAGAATLGNPAEGLDLHLDAKRLDAAGAVSIKLLLVPQTKALTLAAQLDEPEGGIVARAASIPGLPAVKLDLDGKGTLDAFKANLAFDAGPTIGATGGAELKHDGAARRLSLDLESRIEGWLPPMAGAVFAGTTTLEGDIAFADDGAVTIARLDLASRNARLGITGGLSPDRVLDLAIAASAIPGSEGKTAANGSEIKKLDFEARVTGPAIGPQIAADLSAEGLSTPHGKLGALAATFTATPTGLVSDASTRIALAGDAKLSDLVLADPALAEAVGRSVTLNLKGTAAPDGATQIETLRIATPSIAATYMGELGPKLVRGRFGLESGDLGHFANLLGTRLKGALKLSADLEGKPAARELTAKIDAQTTNFASGVGPADGLAGGHLALAGSVRLLPRGYGFDELTLAGAHVTALLDGEATQQAAKIAARIDIPDTKFADPRLSGKAAVAATLSGSTAHPDASFKLALTDARALDRSIPRLTFEGSARDLAGALDAELTLAGEVDRKPLAGATHIAKLANGGWLADKLDFTLGSVALRGNAAVDTAGLANGQISVKAGDLDDISPLLLMKLAGDISLDASLDATDGKQNAKLNAHAAHLALSANRIEGLDADLTAADLFGRKTIDGTAVLAKAMLGSETVSALQLKAESSAGGSDLDLTATARGLAVAAKARLMAQAQPRFDLSSFTARGAGHGVTLIAPARLAFGDAGVEITGLALAVDAGRLRLDGRAGARLDLKGQATGIPLAAAELAAPGLGLTGTLDGQFAISGTPAALAGEWRLKIEGLTAPQTRNSALPPIDIAGSGRLAESRTTLDLTASAARAGSLRLTGSAPMSGAGALDLRAEGKLDAAVASPMLAVSGRRVTGAALVDAHVTGNIAKPQAEGTLSVSGGSFSDVEMGLKLDRIEARIAAHGETLSVERFAATTPNGGTLGASGQVRLDPATGFPGTVRITGQRAQLISNSIVAASADLALDLSGPLGRDPRVGGRIGIVSMDITVPERLPNTSRPIAGTRHVNPTPTARARLTLDAKAKAHAGRKSAFGTRLDLTVSAPNRIFVRGRGLDAELGGDLKVTGTLADPKVVGAFDLRRGRLSVLGKRLDFTRGHVRFTGEMTPELDFLADTQAGDATAHIGITGPASQPVFAFTSDPSLPQDEVLSRILFQKPSGSLSPLQALQLAQAAAQFAGGGDVAFERLRKSLGVDSLDIGMGSSGSPTVGVSRAISDRLSVGVKAGSKPEDSGVSVDFDVTRHIRLQSGVDAKGSSSLGVGAEWEYK
jgi:translocation and assembly module TamB